MAIELKVPAVGESIIEVEIGEWLKARGDVVKKDEPVVTLESEKATVELPAPESGTIGKILKQKGEVAKVGEVIAYLEKDGKAGGEKEIPNSKIQAPKPEDRTSEDQGEKSEVSDQRSEERKGQKAAAILGPQRQEAQNDPKPGEVQQTAAGRREPKEAAIPEAKKKTPEDKNLEREAQHPIPAPSAAPTHADGREEEVVPMSR